MEIEKSFTFEKRRDIELYRYLQKNKIPIIADRCDRVSVCVYESSYHWEHIRQYFSEKNRMIWFSSEPKFSRLELCEAQWLRVCSKWKPTNLELPGSGDKAFYDLEGRCDDCRAGRIQKDAFCFGIEPEWEGHHFLNYPAVADEIFVSNEAMKRFQKAGVTGVSFDRVEGDYGSKILKQVYQMKITTTLRAGLIESHEYIESAIHCLRCGRKIYSPSGTGILSYRKEIFEGAPDIVKTGDLFAFRINPAPHILVRQNVYQIIVENGLDKDLAFYALNLV